MSASRNSRRGIAAITPPPARRYAGGIVRYDAGRRRVWVAGQRLHHGSTGAVLTGVALTGLAAHRFSPRGGLEWALLGSALMAHDWHDRSHWFRRGAQEDPA
jgi:hypothetical protein